MQPLQLNQKFLTLVSLCAPPDDVSNANVLVYAVIGLYVFLTLWSDFASSALFVIQYEKYNLEDVLGSVLQTAAVSSSIFGMVSVFLMSKQLRGIFTQYQTIYDECAHDKSTEILIKTEQMCIRITKILVIKYVVGFIILSATLATTNIFVCYMQDNDVDLECLYTPYKHVLPWNDDTFIGWLYGLLCSFWMSGTYFFINCIFLSFFLSIGFNFDAFQRQFNVIISEINGTNAKHHNFNRYARNVLHRAVHFHAAIKCLFADVKEVYSGVLFAQLLCGTMFTAASLFQMDTAIHNIDIYFYAYVNAVVLSTTNLYLYCYSGATVTVNCLKYADTIFQKDWYLMPVDLQKLLILMIRSAHRPLVYTGYGILKLNLETFTSILKTVMSYYLMFKTLME